MQFFEQNAEVHKLTQRFYQFLVGTEYALEKQGITVGMSKQDTEQHAARRALLNVEEEAKKQKAVSSHGNEKFRTQIDKKFNTIIGKKMASEFDDVVKLHSNVLQLEDAIPGILDVLSVKAASVGRIKLLVNSLYWLSEDILNMVNKPQYRKNADIKVNDPTLAMNYMGLDNVKIILPMFVLKHLLPHSTSPYKVMKRKLWNEGLSIGLASKVIAKHEGVDEFTAYCAGLFSNMGYMAVCRSYLTMYDKLQQHELQKAFNAKDKKLHDILFSLQPSADYLSEELQKQGADISARVVEHMGFKRLWLTESMYQLANETKLSVYTPLAKVIIQAKAFVMFKALHKHQLLDAQEAKKLLAHCEINTELFSLLQKSDITHLNLNINKG